VLLIQSKKLGVFIPFRDFRGRHQDALSKLLTDLKKFGMPNLNQIKLEALEQGYGEAVCQLINELINIELYRRDFEFMPPVFSQDQEGELSEEEENEEFQGQSEIMNGIEISTHLQSPKHSDPFGNQEETKIDFFNPQAELGERTELNPLNLEEQC
jgi:hypothetical protein